jgi:MoaA/NifB/PqqE/SkfB family radical SAM enzyme
MEPKKENVFECSAVTRWIEIELTSYCWMDCIVCARWDLEKYTFLSFENFKKIVELLKQWNYEEVMVCGLWDAFIHEQVNEFMEYLFSKLPKINLFFMTKWLALKDKHLEKILDLKNRWFNVSLTFSVFSLEEKMYNYLTWWNFYKNFMEVLKKVHKMKINYSMEFMLSVLTLWELDKFKQFAKSLWKDFWISLVHNWWWRIKESIHKKMFDAEKLKWHFIKGNLEIFVK